VSPQPRGLTRTLGLFQMRLERAEWGSDLPSVETQLETQRHIHSSVEELGSSVKEARLYEVWQHLGCVHGRVTASGCPFLWVEVDGADGFLRTELLSDTGLLLP